MRDEFCVSKLSEVSNDISFPFAFLLLGRSGDIENMSLTQKVLASFFFFDIIGT